MENTKEIRWAIDKVVGATLFMDFDESKAVRILVDYVEDDLKKKEKAKDNGENR